MATSRRARNIACGVVGRPDLRRVRRLSTWPSPTTSFPTTPASGYLYINDVRLEGIKRENGMAQRAGLRLNMADVFKVDFDWKHNDDTFHGLDKRVGSGIDHEEWSVANSLNLEDYVPLAGFRLPVSGSRRRDDRPAPVRGQQRYRDPRQRPARRHDLDQHP